MFAIKGSQPRSSLGVVAALASGEVLAVVLSALVHLVAGKGVVLQGGYVALAATVVEKTYCPSLVAVEPAGSANLAEVAALAGEELRLRRRHRLCSQCA